MHEIFQSKVVQNAYVLTAFELHICKMQKLCYMLLLQQRTGSKTSLTNIQKNAHTFLEKEEE